MRKIIENKAKQLGYELGCYSSRLDKIITKQALNKILEYMEFDSTDLFLRIRKKLYIVTIETVDNEKDISILSDIEYFNRYDSLDDALSNNDISISEYKKYKKLGL